MKVVTVLGARPQFIKAAPVCRALRSHQGVEEVLVHTGQHFDERMSDVFFRQMELPRPKYSLDINSLGHGAMTGRMLEGIEAILETERPDAVLVYGDTNSTLAGALAACKLHIPVAHVEAGLRSHNLRMPEEYNRILTDRISRFLFVPTRQARVNLEREGFGDFDCSILYTGDVMLDAALLFGGREDLVSNEIRAVTDGKMPFALATIHRQENTSDYVTLRAVVDILERIHREHRVVCPIHPRTRKSLDHYQIKPSFEMLEPVGYIDMLYLLRRSALVVTDSGGLQKEAFFVGRYCVTLRTETEWTELVDGGFNRVCGVEGDRVMEAVRQWFGLEVKGAPQLYGDGSGSSVVAETLAGPLAY